MVFSECFFLQYVPANMKLVSIVLTCLCFSVRSDPDPDPEILLPSSPPDELKMAALAAFQDKKVFADAWKHAAADLHKRYEKIREKGEGLL